MTLIHTDIGCVPLPKGWDLEQTLAVLRKTGHTIINITADGKAIALPVT